VTACGYEPDGALQGCLYLDAPAFISLSPTHTASHGVGAFVVVWESFDTTMGRTVIKGRWVGADGTPITAEFEVISSETTAPRIPRVAVHPEPALVAVWVDDSSDGSDSSGTSIQARYLSPDGAPLVENWFRTVVLLGASEGKTRRIDVRITECANPAPFRSQPCGAFRPGLWAHGSERYHADGRRGDALANSTSTT